MATFEQKSLQYYSSSLEKLDNLLESNEKEQTDTKIFRDDLMSKINYLEKGNDLH